MRWDKLKEFYYVAKTGSISKAAEQLNISQSALSRTIVKVEHMFKKTLFTRSVKGVSLTLDGEIVFESVKKIIVNLEALSELLIDDQDTVKGTLRLTTTNALASMWLPYYLLSFLEQYPDFNLIIIANDDELDLGIREADIAIRPFMPNQEQYIQRYLKTFHMKLYASHIYIEKYGQPKTIKDLDQHRLLVFGGDKSNPYGEVNWLLKLGREENDLRHAYLKLNLGHGLYEMAKIGLGIVALSQEYPQLKNSGLINVLPDVKGPAVDIYYVYHKSLARSQRVTALADYLENALEKKRKLSLNQALNQVD